MKRELRNTSFREGRKKERKKERKQWSQQRANIDNNSSGRKGKERQGKKWNQKKNYSQLKKIEGALRNAKGKKNKKQKRQEKKRRKRLRERAEQSRAELSCMPHPEERKGKERKGKENLWCLKKIKSLWLWNVTTRRPLNSGWRGNNEANMRPVTWVWERCVYRL